MPTAFDPELLSTLGLEAVANSGEVDLLCADKFRLGEIADTVGFRIPERIESVAEADRDELVVVKPRFGTRGDGIRFMTAGEASGSLPLDRSSQFGELFIERRLEGDSPIEIRVTAFSGPRGQMEVISYWRRHLLQGPSNLSKGNHPRYPDELVADEYWQSHLPFDECEDIARAVLRVLAKVGWAVEVGVDFFVPGRRESPVVLEVNSQPGRGALFELGLRQSHGDEVRRRFLAFRFRSISNIAAQIISHSVRN